MQKYLFGICILLLILSTLIVLPNHVQSDENFTINQASVSGTIRYDLPFPGMLPDNPLYKLKVLRDKISLALTNDPQKKIDLYLLLTDKGILASAMLVDKNKIDLALETALKAEHNYTLLTQELYRLNRKPDNDFFNKLEIAASKHQDVLSHIIKRVPQKKQKSFINVLNFSKRNLKTIEEFKDKDLIRQ